VGYFGSGTGFAGVFGSGIILLLTGLGVDYNIIFFVISVSVVPYFISFYYLHTLKCKYPFK
jgi:hypothetical protein